MENGQMGDVDNRIALHQGSDPMKPTDEQSHILNLLHTTKSNILIKALAGTGKTSTLELIESASSGPILCLAFNKKIAEEMAKRFKTTTTVRTFNSLGHRIWQKAQSKNLTLDPKKTQNLLKEHINGLKKTDRVEVYEAYWEIVHGVGLAKSIGYVPESWTGSAKRLLDRNEFFASLDEKPTELVRNTIDEILLASIRASYAGLIDFNDQIYMPALFGGTFPRFPLVLVDERQDLSPTNHVMLEKLRGSRIIAVGDQYQSIYGFRGADESALDSHRKAFRPIECDLTVSFRCPQQIVENVHWRVPHFKWNRTGGIVDRLSKLELNSVGDSTAIICRNNAPLFRLGFKLLSNGISISVIGSDIGPKVVGIMGKLGGADMSRSETLSAIEVWREEHLARESASANDLADCMKVFADHGETLSQAISYAEHLFKQRGLIRLLTGHKAKGLEWDTVYHLDPWLIGESEQELNLKYVIGTRAKEALYEIDSKDIQ